MKWSYAGRNDNELCVRICAGNNILKDIYIYYWKMLFDIAKRITLSVRLPWGCQENVPQKPLRHLSLSPNLTKGKGLETDQNKEAKN